MMGRAWFNANVELWSRRVGLLAVLGVALLAVPYRVEAQGSESLRRIAFLSGEDTCLANRGLSALLDGLRSLGYRPGENVLIDCRSAEGRYDQLDTLAAELVRLRPAVFVASAAPASLAAKRATKSIPIVSVYAADPVRLGIVSSLARPDGNITGISALASEYAGKSLQILKDLAPRTSRVGVIGHAANPSFAIYRRELELAAPTLAIQLDFVGVASQAEIEPALATMVRRGADALFIMHQPLTFAQRNNIVQIVARLRLPAVYGSREAVESGGLVSYAVSVGATHRRAAFIVDKVLHGSKTTDLPFEQPTNFEFVLNLKTAEALDLKVPQSVRLRADRVIE
jgi:putative ABC transport system substrate-binding protein